MKITTKTGDSGMTSLFGHPRVAKNDLRIELLGELDELMSFLGLAKSHIKSRPVQEIIAVVQNDLFVIGAQVVSAHGRMTSRQGITAEQLARMEYWCDHFQDKAEEFRGFILPGEKPQSSWLDVCRAVARRAERRYVAVVKKYHLKDNVAMIYLNRLSDLLYLLARSAEGKSRRR